MSSKSFDYQHPVMGGLFVDRRSELEELQARLRGGANVLVLAPRRLGKSSLIKEAFRQAKDYHGVYVTCPLTGAGHDLAAAILAEVTLPLGKRLKEWFVQQARAIRPVAELDPSGTWRFSFHRDEPPDRVLADTLGLLDAVAKKLERRVVLAIDEVQRILERDPDTFYALRDIVQFQDQVGYVLSGSKFHVLEALLDAENPFGHQLTPIYVGDIPIKDFAAMAKRRFKAAGNQLSEETLQRVGDICRGNPKRTQELLFDLLHIDAPGPSDAEDRALQQVASQHHLFEDLLDQVARGAPMDVLVALAAMPEDIAVYGHEFLKRSRVTSQGHVQSGLESLRRRGLVDQDHRFVDPYLRIYLRTLQPDAHDAPFA